MTSSQASFSEVPTGRWLRAQREVRGLSIAELARQTGLHPSTLRALEERNRVLPPGWYAVLERAGLQIPRVQWPVGMPAYSGSQLARDLQQVPGFRHSVYWLSRQLGIADAELRPVMRLDLSVPSLWLLKLGELGARVPDEVRAVLAESKRVNAQAPQAAAPPEVTTARADCDADSHHPAPTKESSAAEMDAVSFSLTWSEKSGLFIVVSPALLQEMQGVLRATIHEIARSPWVTATAGRSL